MIKLVDTFNPGEREILALLFELHHDFESNVPPRTNSVLNHWIYSYDGDSTVYCSLQWLWQNYGMRKILQAFMAIVQGCFTQWMDDNIDEKLCQYKEKMKNNTFTSLHAPNVCAVCANTDLNQLSRCSQCKSVKYCCKDHQIKGWKKHKKVCKKLAKMTVQRNIINKQTQK